MLGKNLQSQIATDLEYFFINIADFFGEACRKIAFEESLGCYNCFDLIDGFIPHPTSERLALDKYLYEVDNAASLENFEANSYYHPSLELYLAWQWDNDGILYFEHHDLAAINFDCKKMYGWEWC